MVGRRIDVPAAELEAIAVAGEVREVPAVDAVAPGHRVLDLDRRQKLPGVEAVVDVVPQPGSAHPAAGAGALLDTETIGALAVLAGIAVREAVQVQDQVVARCALQLEARLVAIVND